MPIGISLGNRLSSLGQLIMGASPPTSRPSGGGLATGLIPYLAYRVLDPVTGVEIISNLPHPHRSRWTIRFLQPGTTGAGTLGDFEIPLFAPLDDGFRDAAEVYAKLAYGQRVEGYLSPTGDVVSGGQPKFSGVITQLPIDFAGTYAIKGKDSMQLLNQTRTNRTEFFTGTTDQLAAFALRGQTLVYGDDLSAGVGAYTQLLGSWSAATDESLPVATISGAATGVLLTPTSYPAANFGECAIDAFFRIQLSNLGPVRLGVLAGSSTANTQTFGGVNIRFVNSQRWEVDLEIGTVVAGSVTNRARKTLALALPASPLRCQLALTGRAGTYNAASGVFTPNPSGPDIVWRITISGVDGNCVWIQTGAAQAITGPVGFYYAGAADSAIWGTQLVFRNRQAFFQKGTFVTGVQTVQQYFSRTPNLDILGLATVTEGFIYRKTAARGLNQDVVDFAPAPGLPGGVGSDSVVRFEWGGNLTDAKVDPNADALASDISMQLSAGGIQAGQIDWHNVAAMKKFGILTDTVQAQHVADFVAARSLAQSMALIKGTPGAAKTLKVQRDAATADLWREGDWIRVHAPHVGLNEARVQVLEYTLTEGSLVVDVVADKWPLDATRTQLIRMWQTVDALASGTQNLSPSSSTGLVYDSRYGSPTILPAYGNDSLDAANNFHMRFNIPVNVVLIQRVTLAFSVLPYRTYSTLNITSATTGNNSVDHTHAGPSHSHPHSHTFGTWNSNDGDFVAFQSYTDGGGTLFELASKGTTTSLVTGSDSTAGGTGATGVQSQQHTHSVTFSGSSTLGIQEDVVAQGCHVLIDGTDVTGQLVPSGPYGIGAQQDFGELDITSFVLGGGFHDLQITSTTRGRVTAQVQAYVIVKPF